MVPGAVPGQPDQEGGTAAFAGRPVFSGFKMIRVSYSVLHGFIFQLKIRRLGRLIFIMVSHWRKGYNKQGSNKRAFNRILQSWEVQGRVDHPDLIGI
jgi:hypothetical protein